MLIKLLKYKIVIQEGNSLLIEVQEVKVITQNKINKIITYQIFKMDYVYQLKVKVINKNLNNAVIKAEIRKQNQQFPYPESRIINNLNYEHKKCKKVSRCYGNVWENFGKIVEFHNM
jgi:hypothetical protein